MKCACTLGLRAPAAFSESAELWCACPSFRREKFTEPTRYGLVKYVEDSLNSAGLLAFTALLLVPPCKRNGWSPFSLYTPPHQVKGPLCPTRARHQGTPAGLSSNHRRRHARQIRCKKCLASLSVILCFVINADQDINISLIVQSELDASSEKMSP